MKIVKKLIPLVSLAALTPFLALAQGACNTGNSAGLGDVLCRISVLLATIMPILVALGVVYFVWGVITYMIANDEEAKKRGRNMVIYGLIALVIIVSIWGLVSILKTTLGIGQSTGNIYTPCFTSPGVTC
ncbi:MAG: pilin [Candidatus Nomurabacteria bacterium]|nr:pilin [Candidatus Nomurabacteria bacterium]